MTYNNLEISTEDKIGLITINRPKALNALNKETIEELSNAFGELESNEDIRVIILTGSGEKAFVAGADIKEFKDFDGKQGQQLAQVGQTILFNKIENLKKPVIAAVNGYALGGGLELAMSCHFRIASDNALLGLPEVTLGLIPGYGGTQRLPKLIGKGRAMQAIMTAEMFKAEKAEQIGLVNEVVALDELLPRAKKIASKIAFNSPVAISKAIEVINLSDSDKGFEAEINAFGELFDAEDFKEGTTAFLEKRKPNF
ncbi:enoyl-CoA hydratase-related protein [Weeksellaceae bacterium KMM 9724]|uniref:enoyl-CoA hydratase/isomerase family protein n=1 Tax=Profundicola chukchiensis TaxID=2961959 RepID=UPI00243868C6|nr:enoyl-CoA hydratase-related protein [Profundicola chukchiensis]MDG4949405.1 enoyl-CoA hydratase-related protein [Profundicola chukchiensis]